jgi:DNA-binding PucR family transcriptional regulator
VQQAAARAEWTPPATLTAVIVAQAQARQVRAALPGVVLQAVDRTDIPDDWALLLVPDADGRRRAGLLETLTAPGCIAGPARPWLQVRASYDRALRARAAGLSGDTENHLTRLVLTADPEALADLRARALEPLSDLRPAVAEKLADTLRSWLLHHGRREDVAAELFVHPQTVRYRMGQLRELYGDRLDDPETVLELTIALSAESTPRRP